ncbi:hypothetical protein Bhyg_12273 [Pseudolycoriella hygida]|uniref:Uncharacterized protein n=1 Tax=Pseudolycoriella hygida TaxID=35572 RepID=A0A9Q0S0A0_9DIPT|nr:hypothetical protein Bhyg_12273 [Pseudolycoriella hygida]
MTEDELSDDFEEEEEVIGETDPIQRNKDTMEWVKNVPDQIENEFEPQVTRTNNFLHEPIFESTRQNYIDNSGQNAVLIAAFKALQTHDLKDLPTFNGNNVLEWPNFISEYRRSTEEFNISPNKNLRRLNKALEGNARRSVQTLLTSPDNIKEIISHLEMSFGRPEWIIQHLITELREPGTSIKGLSKEEDVTEMFKMQQGPRRYTAHGKRIESEKLSAADELALKIMSSTMKNIGDRFEVGHLYKYPGMKFPTEESKQLALKRLYSVERKMDRDQKFADEYIKRVDDYLEKGYAEKSCGDSTLNGTTKQQMAYSTSGSAGWWKQNRSDNRITKILDCSNREEWFWIPTHLNTADLATKTSNPVDLSATSTWFNGPEFLKLPETQWPEFSPPVPNENEILLFIHELEPKEEMIATIRNLHFPGNVGITSRVEQER